MVFNFLLPNPVNPNHVKKKALESAFEIVMKKNQSYFILSFTNLKNS
jgi:hypothetical protein